MEQPSNIDEFIFAFDLFPSHHPSFSRPIKLTLQSRTSSVPQFLSSIGKYKEEYAQLISQAEAIKNTLKTVQDKVRKSEKDRFLVPSFFLYIILIKIVVYKYLGWHVF